MSNSNKRQASSRYLSNKSSTPSKSQISENNYNFQIIKSGDYNKTSSQNLNFYADVTDGPKQSRHTQVNPISSESIVKLKCKSKCPICFRSSTAYYCSMCVRNGNFYHSSMKLPERFAEKRIRERRLRQHIAELEKRAASEIPSQFKRDNLKNEIATLKEKNRLIKKVIASGRRKIEKAREEENILKYQIQHLKNTVPLFQRKNANILQNITLYSQRIQEKTQKNEELEKAFQVHVKDKINQLTKVIFPLAKVAMESGSVESSDPADDVTVKELAEASQTHYVKGRWITNPHFMNNKSYSILSVTLPDVGGYTSLCRSQRASEVDEKIEAQNICAALTYVCQLVNIVAFYIGIHLPHKIGFSDLSDVSRQEMSERKFQLLVARLNVNVLYLCASQGVSSNLLHPLRIMPNLVTLLGEGQTDLGRNGYFELPDSVIEILEEFDSCDDNAESDSEDDWETVGSMPVAEFSSSPSPAFRRPSPDDTASGIVTSAAASVISIFRGIGNSSK